MPAATAKKNAGFDPEKEQATIDKTPRPAAESAPPGPPPSSNGDGTPENPPAVTVPAQAAANTAQELTNGDQPPPSVANFVTLVAPSNFCDSGYAADHIDFRGMTRAQRAGAKRLFLSLGRAGARIQTNGTGHPDGKVVNTPGDAVKWIFEQYAAAYEASTGASITEGLDF